MPNFALLSTGQQAATGSAVALPVTCAATPTGTGTVGANQPGPGMRVKLASKSSGSSVFYGPAGVTTSTGKELVSGVDGDEIVVNDTSEIYIVGSGTCTWVAFALY